MSFKRLALVLTLSILSMFNSGYVSATSFVAVPALDGEQAQLQRALAEWLISIDANWPLAHDALIVAGFQFEARQAPCRNYTYLRAGEAKVEGRTIAIVWCPPEKKPMVLITKFLPVPTSRFPPPVIVPPVPKAGPP